MNRGSLGIRELNVKLQGELNSARPEVPLSGSQTTVNAEPEPGGALAFTAAASQAVCCNTQSRGPRRSIQSTCSGR